VDRTGNTQPSLDRDEHDVSLIAKRTASYGYDTNAGQPFRVGNPSGGMVQEYYDYVAIAYPTTTSETYTFKAGGSGGTTVATLTLTYVDSTKAQLSAVAKT